MVDWEKRYLTPLCYNYHILLKPKPNQLGCCSLFGICHSLTMQIWQMWNSRKLYPLYNHSTILNSRHLCYSIEAYQIHANKISHDHTYTISYTTSWANKWRPKDDLHTSIPVLCLAHSVYVLEVMSQSIVQCIMGLVNWAASTWKVISNSLDVGSFDGGIHVRSCKKYDLMKVINFGFPHV